MIKFDKKNIHMFGETFDFRYSPLFLSHLDIGIEEKDALLSELPKGIVDEDEEACGTEVDPLGIRVRP